MVEYHQGKFKPRNPHKYKGDHNNILYRSGWELQMMNRFDQSSDIVEWSSEELVIPYVSPVDGRVHRYFIDFKIKTADGVVSLIEVKPANQIAPPQNVGNVKPSAARGKANKPNRRFLKEVVTYGVNMAKWRAANNYAKDRKWKFVLAYREKELWQFIDVTDGGLKLL